MDEPFNALDVRTQEAICTAMYDLRGQGKTLLVATHDLRRLSGTFDSNVHLQCGELISSPEANPCCLIAEKERAWTG